MSTADRNEGKPPWHFRRRAIVSTLVYCAGSFSFAQYQGAEMVAAVAGPLAMLASATLAAAIGGAVWDDKGRGN